MRSLRHPLVLCMVLAFCTLMCAQCKGEKPDLKPAEAGRPGGRLSIAVRTEPKTFNPVIATDTASQLVIRRMMADLIHINRGTLKTEPALALNCKVSEGGRRITLELRRDVRFSDGAPFDADDVVFTFKVFLDEKVASSQRSLLMVGGKPVRVEKIDAYRLRFTFPAPYAVAERFFDSIVILPRHLLEKEYNEGRINEAWNVSTPPEKIVGLGPFRLKRFVPGERTVLERNPYYWKVDAKGQRLPYLNELVFLTVPNQDAEAVRFRAGDTQITGNLNTENFTALQKDEKAGHFHVKDLGTGLEYSFLLFNLNFDIQGRLPEVARHQKWFSDVRFRQAVSAAIDRDAIVRLAYQSLATPLATHITPAYGEWFNHDIPAPQLAPQRARELLKLAGFSWKKDGSLIDASGQAVEFTIMVSSSNHQRTQIAALIQEDLKKIGMKASVVAMEFKAMQARITGTHDFDTAVMALQGGDTDPNTSMDVWISSGETHYWHPSEKKPATPWEAEIDKLLQAQLVEMDTKKRKALHDRMLKIAAEQAPMICLVSPHVLVGASDDVGNFNPAILDPFTLWNADELFWKGPAGK